MLKDDTVFVDIETTGGNAVRDRITEIAIITMSGGELVSEWSTLINPEISIPSNIQRLTGISNEMVMDMPGFQDICKDVLSRLEGRLFTAHNARFDYGFIKNEFKRCEIRFSAPVLCTVKLSRKLFPDYPRHNLDSIIRRHNLQCSARHRAMGDARVLFDFMQTLYTTLNPDQIEHVIRHLLKRPSLPAGLSEDDVNELPESPGVYLFYDKHHTPIYIGKSKNIRERVLSHFNADYRSSKEMKISQNIGSIEYILTAGELGALLEESRLIKKLLPIYNHKLRRHDSLYTIKWSDNQPPVITDASTIDASEVNQYFGLFKSKKQARNTLGKLAKEHQLCQKVMGLENGHGPCFAYQLKKCKGACVENESILQHNIRLAQALLPLKNKTWPYPGKIGIREYSKAYRRTDIHIFDRWCYLGVAHNEAELHQLNLFHENDALFDLDTYKILVRFLKDHPDLKPLNLSS